MVKEWMTQDEAADLLGDEIRPLSSQRMAALRKVPGLLRTKPVKVRGGQSYLYLRKDVEAYLATRNKKGGRPKSKSDDRKREWRNLLVAELLEELLRLEGTAHLWLCDLIRFRQLGMFQSLAEVDKALQSDFMDIYVHQRFRILGELATRSPKLLELAQAYASKDGLSARERAQWFRFIRGAVRPAVKGERIPPGRGGLKL